MSIVFTICCFVVWAFSSLIFGFVLCEELEDTTTPFVEIAFVWEKTKDFNLFGRIILCIFAGIWFFPISLLGSVIYAIVKFFCFLFWKRR